MKILLVTPYYPPDLGPSAPMLGMLAEDLARRGHAVTVLAAVPHFPSGEVPVDYRKGLWQWSEQNGVRLCRVRVPSGDRRNLCHRLLTFLVYQVLVTWAGKSLDYDVALITNPALETGLPFAVLSGLRRKPAVFAVWDLYPEVGVQLGIFRHRLVIWTVRALEDFCLRRAQRVQALAEGFVSNLQARAASPSRVVHIPPWLDTDFIRPLPRKNPFSQEHGLDDCFVVLYAGNLGFSQGLEQVLAAAEQLRVLAYIRFVFVGDGPARCDLVDLANKLALSNVVFVPFQPRARLPEVLATADLSLVSLSAGVGKGSLPSKTYSALASGRPILAVTDEGNDLWQLVTKSHAGRCVLAGQPQAIASAVLELVDSPQLRQELGENGRQYVVSHHSRQSACQSFEQLFEQMIQEVRFRKGINLRG